MEKSEFVRSPWPFRVDMSAEGQPCRPNIGVLRSFWLAYVTDGSSFCGRSLHRVRSFTDDIDDEVRMGQHRDVAAVDSVNACPHPLRQEAFQVRLHRTVVVGHDVPTRLGLPGDTRHIPAEEVGSRGIVGRPDQFLFFFREISCEALDALGTHPDAPVRYLDVLEHVGNRELLLLALRGSSASGASAAM
jgi:hypothetical protein